MKSEKELREEIGAWKTQCETADFLGHRKDVIMAEINTLAALLNENMPNEEVIIIKIKIDTLFLQVDSLLNRLKREIRYSETTKSNIMKIVSENNSNNFLNQLIKEMKIDCIRE